MRPHMLITSHLFVTITVGKAAGLNHAEWIAALVSGVLVDADHLLVNRKWWSDVKRFLRHGTITHGEVKQHSWIQEPLPGAVIGAFAGMIAAILPWGIRWWVIPLFLLAYIALDLGMRYQHEPFIPLSRWSYRGFLKPGTLAELVISTLGCLAVLALF